MLVVINGYGEDRAVGIEDVAPHLPPASRLVDLITGETLPLDLSGGIPLEAWGSRVLLVR